VLLEKIQMLESIILVILFAVAAVILSFSATAKFSNGAGGTAKDLGAIVQAQWPQQID
jgi:hypothetical protein